MCMHRVQKLAGKWIYFENNYMALQFWKASWTIFLSVFIKVNSCDKLQIDSHKTAAVRD